MPPPPEPKTVLIAGAGGFVGSVLKRRLTQAGHHVISLRREAASDGLTWNYDPDSGRISTPLDARLDWIVNLGGENIASGRWTARVKERIRDSRLNLTRALVQMASGLSEPPSAFFSASGSAYYGTGGPFDESYPPGGKGEFLAEVCQDWEATARNGLPDSVRFLVGRFGLILSPEGGALKRMLPVFRLGLGGKLGDGKQRVSWISLDDAVEAIFFLLRSGGAGRDGTMSGAFNFCAPEAVTNQEFTRALAAALGRPAFLTVPAFALKLVMGDLARETLLADCAMAPRRLIEAGFRHQAPELAECLRRQLKKD